MDTGRDLEVCRGTSIGSIYRRFSFPLINFTPYSAVNATLPNTRPLPEHLKHVNFVIQLYIVYINQFYLGSIYSVTAIAMPVQEIFL